MAQNEPNILPHLSTNFVTVGEKSTVGAPLVTPSYLSTDAQIIERGSIETDAELHGAIRALDR